MQEPIHITFEVAGGWVAPAMPLHLDALLAYTITERELADMDRAPQSEAELISIGEDPANMPLERFERDGEWVWMASAITPSSPVLNDARFYTRRRNATEFSTLVGAGHVSKGRFDLAKPLSGGIDSTRGPYRNLLEYFPVQRPATEGPMLLEAWCVGDLGRVEELLTDDRAPTHLGSRRRMGFGRIIGVHVEADTAAFEKWKNRVKPWALLDGETNVQAACRAPYWSAQNRRSAWMPSTL